MNTTVTAARNAGPSHALYTTVTAASTTGPCHALNTSVTAASVTVRVTHCTQM